MNLLLFCFIQLSKGYSWNIHKDKVVCRSLVVDLARFSFNLLKTFTKIFGEKKEEENFQNRSGSEVGAHLENYSEYWKISIQMSRALTRLYVFKNLYFISP